MNWISFPKSQNLKTKALKNIHKGKRAFILGNGPSLEIEDLDKLKNEITFASNKIYLAFDQTDWRPTYYCVEDLIVAQNNSDIISKLELPCKILRYELSKYFKNDSNFIYINSLPENSYRKNNFRFVVDYICVSIL